MTEQQFKRAIDEVIEGNGTISVLKQDFSILRQDVAELKVEFRKLGLRMNKFLVEQHRQGLILENMLGDLRAIAQTVLREHISDTTIYHDA